MQHDTDEQELCHSLMAQVDAMKAAVSNSNIDRSIKVDLECFCNYLDDAVHDYLAPAIKEADERAMRLHGDDDDDYTSVDEKRALAPAGYGR